MPGGDHAANVRVTIKLIGIKPAETTGGPVVDTEVQAYTDNDGYLSVELIRTDAITPQQVWEIICQPCHIKVRATLTTSTKDIADLL